MNGIRVDQKKKITKTSVQVSENKLTLHAVKLMLYSDSFTLNSYNFMIMI
jgi:hypothetical protein